ncbi:MAG: DUF2513 domain-containing protein [Gemmatimonadaceae bacterium]
MKRDIDLVRQIMMNIEDLPSGPSMQFRMGEVDDPVVRAHLEMMISAGLVNGKITEPYGARGAVIIISGLSWEGHEWIETVRDDGLWNEVKITVLNCGGALTFEIARDVANQILRKRLRLPAE